MDPMEPAKKLMERFAQEIEPLGLHLHTFAILPNPDGPPHAVQVMLTFDGADLDAIDKATGEATGENDDAKLSPEEAGIFAMLERDLTRSTEEEKAQEAAKGLEGLLKSLEQGAEGGILGDEEEK